MNAAALHPDEVPTARNGGDAGARLYLPPRRLRTYQWVKALGGLLFAGLFVGWMLVQGSNPAMLAIAALLAAITVYVTAISVIGDHVRGRGRQIAEHHGTLTLTDPEGSASFELSQVEYARFAAYEEAVDPADAGLFFYDANDQLLGRIDPVLLQTEDEARAFLGWLRDGDKLPFTVRWPEPRL